MAAPAGVPQMVLAVSPGEMAATGATYQLGQWVVESEGFYYICLESKGNPPSAASSVYWCRLGSVAT